MAIWQYRFQIIPKDSFERVGLLFFDNEGFFDEEIYWLEEEFFREEFLELNGVLPINRKSSDEDLLVFGSLESNCISLYTESNKVVSVSCSVDFSSHYRNFVLDLIEFLQRKGLVMLSAEDLEQIPLNIFSIEVMMKKSRNYDVYSNLLNKKNDD